MNGCKCIHFYLSYKFNMTNYVCLEINLYQYYNILIGIYLIINDLQAIITFIQNISNHSFLNFPILNLFEEFHIIHLDVIIVNAMFVKCVRGWLKDFNSILKSKKCSIIFIPICAYINVNRYIVIKIQTKYFVYRACYCTLSSERTRRFCASPFASPS